MTGGGSPARSGPALDAPGPRLVELDALRGIAALSVVLFHYTWLFSELFPGRGQSWRLFAQGDHGVHLFFFISGFVILMTARRRSTPTSFLRARATRLYPPYWAALTLTVLGTWLLGATVLMPSTGEWLVNYTMLQKFLRVHEVDGAYWSLAIELIFYALVAVLLVRGRLTARTVLACSAAWLALALGVVLTVPRTAGIPSFIHVITVADYAYLFVAGMVGFLVRAREISPLWTLPMLVIATTFGALLEGVVGGALSLGIVAAGFAVASLRTVAPLRWGPLVRLGEVSYPLYLVHQNLGYSMLLRLEHVVPWPVAVAIALIVVLVLAWVVHELVEVRFSRWLRRRSARPTVSAGAADPQNAFGAPRSAAGTGPDHCRGDHRLS